MKRVLIAKEWAGLRPFVWLLVVMVLLDLLDLGSADLHEWHRAFTLFETSRWTESAVLTVLLAFAMGSGLLVRELEDGTLAFLDGLPVRRRDVFLAKLAVAGGCLFAYAMVTPLLGWILHVLLRHSVDEPVTVAALAWLALRYLLLATAGLALGLLFGFVRYLAWALLAVAAAAVMLLRSTWPRIGAAFDPVQLVADGWSTRGWGGDTVWALAALSAACLLLAWLLFAAGGGAGMQRLARLAQHRLFVAAMCAAGSIALPAALYLTQDADREAPEDEIPVADSVPTPRSTPDRDGTGGETGDEIGDESQGAHRGAAKFVTAHYTFNIPAGRAIDRRDLEQADAAFATAAAALAIDMADAPRIDVDLTGSITHTAGLAGHNRIRVNVEPGWRDTLVHETVHVMAGWLAGGERGRGLDRMSLFNEGLAHWAEPAYRHAADLRAQERLAVATVFRRRLLSQDQLLDNRTLQRQLDWKLQYPLGAGLIEALTKRYGKEAPARVLAMLGRPDFPPDLEGYELYRSAFQQAGFDLNLVLNDYALALRKWSDGYAALIDAMPRPRGLLVRAPGQAGIAVQLDRPLAEEERLIVQFRPRADSPIDDVVVVNRFGRHGGRPVAWLPLDQVAGNQVCYQIGVRTRGRDMVEPWRCLPLRAAARD